MKFFLGEETHYIIESYEEREQSIFSEQYKKALGVIDGYINAKADSNSDRQGGLRNNIVAFIGDRGTGKTSCMLSLLNMLTKHSESRESNKKFASLDTIDPSFFDTNTNILYLVVGKMFSAFKKEMEETNAQMGHRDSEIHELMMAFHNVQSYLSRMQKSPLDDNDSELNQLSNLLVTVDLKDGMKKLVDQYLIFFKSDYLVIPVDDIDNNTEHAYIMAEQLRKYLVLPNVIVLISFKLEQLASVIDLHFMRIYEPLIKQQSGFSKNDITDMTQKYLLKLFPHNQRISLPNMDLMMDRELEVYSSRENPKLMLGGSSVKYTMTALIFKKTRYLFYHSKGETSPIVPTNLREYRTLLSMLCNMTAYLEEKEDYNKQLFRDYFYEDWVDKHLDEKGRSIAHTLLKNKEASIFNKLVLDNLSGYLPDREQYELQMVTEGSNATYNVSIGDVFAFLNEIRKSVVTENIKSLLFFIESLYSIKLYHYYDEMTGGDENGTFANKMIDDTIKRLDLLEGVSNYEKLIGGDFFNPNMLKLLPVESKTNKGRAYRVVNLMPLKELLVRTSDDNPIGELELQTIEFFALTLSRRLQGKKRENLYPAYRQLKEVYYRSDLNTSKKAVFELGSFFSNITRMEYAYNRLYAGLFELANKQPNSLLNQMKLLTMKRESLSAYDKSRFLSWCCIRNAVVLQEFGNKFSYVKEDRTRSSDQLNLLKVFFKDASEFKIRTYDRSDDGKDAHVISFDYLKVFVDYFVKVQENENVKKLFYDVFGDIDDSISEANVFDVSKLLIKTKEIIVKRTLRKRIIDMCPELKENAEFWEYFNSKIPGSNISREEARIILQELKNHFDL